jgi:hypothetical protein
MTNGTKVIIGVTAGVAVLGGIVYLLTRMPSLPSSPSPSQQPPLGAVGGVRVVSVNPGPSAPGFTLEIAPVPGATSYKVLGGTMVSMSCGDNFDQPTTWAVAPFTSDGSYFFPAPGFCFPLTVNWQVQACNAAGCGPVATVSFPLNFS